MKESEIDIIDLLVRLYKKNKDRDIWLKEQNIEDMINELRSEIKELEEEVKKGNKEGITEESGDVLWDALLLITKISQEFGIKERVILRRVIEKQKRRKPWLFEEGPPPSKEEIRHIWEEAKKKEEKEKRL